MQRNARVTLRVDSVTNARSYVPSDGCTSSAGILRVRAPQIVAALNGVAQGAAAFGVDTMYMAEEAGAHGSVLPLASRTLECFDCIAYGKRRRRRRGLSRVLDRAAKGRGRRKISGAERVRGGAMISPAIVATSRLPVEYTSAMAFSPTVTRLVEVLEAAGMKIFARIDHAAGAHEVGLVMPPTVLLVYGNPKGGTPIMLAAPQAGLELPLRVLVREDGDGSTRISFRPIAPLLREVGVPEELAGRLEPAQRMLFEALKV